MANYATLKAAIADVVKTNGNQAITGANLQTVLLSIVNTIGAKYTFAGVATPSTDPGDPDQNVFYIGAAGTYANFGTSVTIPEGSIGVFMYNGSWTKSQVKLFDVAVASDFDNPDATKRANIPTVGAILDRFVGDGVYDVSARNGGATFASLEALLSNENLATLIPTQYRHGGMEMRFVHTSENKYVQYRLMSDSFNTTVANWQGVDDVPVAGSNNLVKSGGVENSLSQIIGRAIDKSLFIYGSITSQGEIIPLEHYTDYNRAITKYPIPFKAGNVFHVETDGNYKYYIWKYVNGIASRITGWTNESRDFTVTEDCVIEFLVGRVDDENFQINDIPIVISHKGIIDTIEEKVDTIEKEIGNIQTLFGDGTVEEYINATRASNTGDVGGYVRNRITSIKEVEVRAGDVIKINVAAGQRIAVNKFIGDAYTDLGWVNATTERTIDVDCRIVVVGANRDNSDILPSEFMCSVELLPQDGNILERLNDIEEEIDNLSPLPFTERDMEYVNIMTTVFHRGARDICPENTLPAFARCKVLGVAGFETDLAFTSDNVPILIHDMEERYGRVRDAEGNIISGVPSDFTYAQLMQYEVGSYKSEAYRGTKIPTLAEACDLIRTLELTMVLELKFGPLTAEQAQIAINVIKEYGVLKKVRFLSGNRTESLNLILEQYPYAIVIYGIFNTDLTQQVLNNIISLRNGKNVVYAYIYNYDTITEEKVNLLKENDIRLMWGIVPSSQFSNVNSYVSEVMTEAPNDYTKYRTEYFENMILE